MCLFVIATTVWFAYLLLTEGVIGVRVEWMTRPYWLQHLSIPESALCERLEPGFSACQKKILEETVWPLLNRPSYFSRTIVHERKLALTLRSDHGTYNFGSISVRSPDETLYSENCPNSEYGMKFFIPHDRILTRMWWHWGMTSV